MNLTQLARKTLEQHFLGKTFGPDEKTKERYKDKKACFVTLTEKGELRGCIGTFDDDKELWKNVQGSAIDSAFKDSRFFPLQESELEKIKIEISVLSKSKKLKFENPEDLLKKINKDMGIILKKRFNSATFLPQVWKELSDKKDFLEHLGRKAGLSEDAWKQKGTEFFYYNVEIEKEN